MQSIQERILKLPFDGKVDWIGLSPGGRREIVPVDAATARVGTGLDGDYHSLHHPGGIRQVTLIQAEHLPVIGQLCQISDLHPSQLRRNLVVSGINLIALKKQRFQIGDAILEGTGPCDPCSRMDQTVGPGGWQAMRGHGGITARVLQDGLIRCGDPVMILPPETIDEVPDNSD
ncbi:MAG: MOSC domain-containing protein [Planctomycetaceae bacterium]